MVLTEHVIELWGEVVGKKNAYTPRKDRPGVFKTAKLRSTIDRLAIQVPGWARNLRLLHPDVDIQFYLPDGRRDRDGLAVTIIDILKTQGVIANDATASFNGTLRILPAIKDPEYRTVVILKENPNNSFKEKTHEEDHAKEGPGSEEGVGACTIN